MQLVHNRCAKFIIDPARHQKARALPDLLHKGCRLRGVFRLRDAGSQGIFGRTVLDIHRDVIDKSSLKHLPENSGMGSVGVKLYRVPQCSDPADEIRQVRMQAGFSARDRHAVQKSLSLFQEGKELRFLHDGRRLSRSQLIIVAVGAAQIAAAQKHCAGHVAGKIQQCHFL